MRARGGLCISSAFEDIHGAKAPLNPPVLAERWAIDLA